MSKTVLFALLVGVGCLGLGACSTAHVSDEAMLQSDDNRAPASEKMSVGDEQVRDHEVMLLRGRAR